jgi:hypothetical protein
MSAHTARKRVKTGESNWIEQPGNLIFLAESIRF